MVIKRSYSSYEIIIFASIATARLEIFIELADRRESFDIRDRLRRSGVLWMSMEEILGGTNKCEDINICTNFSALHITVTTVYCWCWK